MSLNFSRRRRLALSSPSPASCAANLSLSATNSPLHLSQWKYSSSIETNLNASKALYLKTWYISLIFHHYKFTSPNIHFKLPTKRKKRKWRKREKKAVAETFSHSQDTHTPVQYSCPLVHPSVFSSYDAFYTWQHHISKKTHCFRYFTNSKARFCSACDKWINEKRGRTHSISNSLLSN